MQAIEHQIVEFLTHLLQTIGWPGVIGIMALESANIPIPSEVTMPLSGWMLVQARGLTALTALWQGGLYGAIGCTIGSVLSYALGAWGGRPLLRRYGKWILVHEEDLDKRRQMVSPLRGLGRVYLPLAAHRADFHFVSGRRDEDELRQLCGIELRWLIHLVWVAGARRLLSGKQLGSAA